ncbi:hypothetical protein [Streptomyces uncialis]|uniref:hypothetical protein n=1 Tax=Streptomyces uncialis TaxID=1048205 RepID=UPI00093F146A|nr:hypothetical protein [Streptomyces uncialis]
MDLGCIGIWSLAFTHGDRGAAREAAAELEELSYGTLRWGGNPGGNPRADLVTTAELLAATNHAVVSPACVSIWHQHALALAAAYHALPARTRDRLLLGLGVGHPRVDQDYHHPYTSLYDYLDELDGLHAPVPRSARLLCAHGPQMTRLAAARTAGLQPHLTDAGHTAYTREVLGDGPLLAPSVSVVLETDPATARNPARSVLAMGSLGQSPAIPGPSPQITGPGDDVVPADASPDDVGLPGNYRRAVPPRRAPRTPGAHGPGEFVYARRGPYAFHAEPGTEGAAGVEVGDEGRAYDPAEAVALGGGVPVQVVGEAGGGLVRGHGVLRAARSPRRCRGPWVSRSGRGW